MKTWIKRIAGVLLILGTFTFDGLTQPAIPDGDYKHSQFKRIDRDGVKMETTDRVSIDKNYKHQAFSGKSQGKAVLVKVEKTRVDRNYKHQVPLEEGLNVCLDIALKKGC